MQGEGEEDRQQNKGEHAHHDRVEESLPFDRSIEDGGDEHREQHAGERRENRRKEHLRPDLVPVNASQLEGRGQRGAPQRADQGMRRARRDAEIPGDQIPDDRAQQRRQHQLLRGDRSIDDLGHRVGDLGRIDDATDDVEAGGHDKRVGRLERARSDAGRDRVRGVVESVGVVEEERDHDHRDQDPADVAHAPLSLTRERGRPIGSLMPEAAARVNRRAEQLGRRADADGEPNFRGRKR